MKIVSSQPLPEWAAEELGSSFELQIAQSPHPESVRRSLDGETVGLIVRSSTPVDAQLLSSAPSLKALGRAGVGYDSIDVDQATRRGIVVLYTPDALTRPTAEHAVALILAACKDLRGWHARACGQRWLDRNRIRNLDLQGATLGVVGYGRIGRLVAQLLQPFGVRLLACDPSAQARAACRQDGGEAVELQELMRRSDIVSLHAPLNEKTRGLINKDNLSDFKPGAILVNAARGQLIRSDRLLVEALDQGILGFVALDVLCQEPPESAHPLLRHPRALITAHVGSRTRLAQESVIRTLILDLRTLLEGNAPTLGNIVNPQALPAFQRPIESIPQCR